MIPTEIALFRSMTLLPFESLGLMEPINDLPLSLWSVHPWSEVHCPQVDLKHHQLWVCWLWQVVLCWRAGDLPLPSPNPVSHSDKGDIRTRSCKDAKGICTACTSFNSLYWDQTGKYRHANLPTFEWVHTQWDKGPSLVWMHTQVQGALTGPWGQIVCTW